MGRTFITEIKMNAVAVTSVYILYFVYNKAYNRLVHLNSIVIRFNCCAKKTNNFQHNFNKNMKSYSRKPPASL